MAQLNPDLMELAAAASAATLTTSRKLIRNFSYYRTKCGTTETICRDDLLQICHNIRMDAFGMHNLLQNEENRHSPFLVSLAGEINDSLEELHRKVLFFPADAIETLIPEIDKLRSFWNNYTDEAFYQNLNSYLQDVLPKSLTLAVREIDQLPALVKI